MRLHSILITLFCISGTLFSQNLPQKLPMSDIEGGSVCMVEGVNVITGHYSYSHEPLVVPGPEPVAYQLSYNSELLWQNNQKSSLYFPLYDYKTIGMCRYFQFGTGGHLSVDQRGGDLTFKINANDKDNAGLTNIGQGQISGKTSHRNLKVRVPNEAYGGHVYVTTGSGEVKTFSSILCEELAATSLLTHEEKPSGNHIYYDNPEITKERAKIRSVNPDHTKAYGSIEFKSYKDAKPTLIEASDGRQVSITYGKIKGHTLPTEISHPHMPYYGFEYLAEFEKPTLFKIFKGKGRQYELTYWGQGRKNEPRYRSRGRVQRISRKLGDYLGHHNIYNFNYFYEEDKGKLTGGMTTVTDSMGYKRFFHYNDNFQITRICHASTDGKALKNECFEWDQEKLVCKSIFNNEGSCVFAQRYGYDSKGNVTSELIIGTYSGYNACLESVLHKFTYSDDKFNNLISSDDGNTLTRYIYKENTDLCTHEYVTHTGNILLRKFREYDKNATLIKEIADDGLCEEENDLTGVTKRLIRHYKPKTEVPCIGFPIEVREAYLDLETGEEKQLKRFVNEYTREGWITKQEVYDANDSYCYTLEWEYNRFGKVTREVNSMGQVTVRDYDIYGNIAREEGPKPGQVTCYEYNFLDQPLRKEIRDSTGLVLVENYVYNAMGVMTQSRDVFGNETVYKYDSFGRNIEKILPSVPRENSLHSVSLKEELDCLGNPVEITDALGKATKTTYNLYGKPLVISYPDGTEERFYYNINDTLRVHIAKNGTQTHYDHDCLLRMTSKTVISSDGEVLSKETKTYDHSSLLSETDPAGVETHYTYDYAGRKISESTGNCLKTYEYDALGRLSQVKNWISDSKFTAAIKDFDYLNRVTEERVEDETGQVFSRILYEYDEAGNRTKVIEFIDDAPSVTETEYNCLGSPTKIIDPEGNITTIQYRYDHINEFGQTVLQTITTDPKGIITIETCNTHSKPVSIEKRNLLGEVIQRIDNQYDLNGNCLKTAYTVITPGKEDRIITNLWEYDSMNRPVKLIEAKGTDDQRVTLTTYNALGTVDSVAKPNGVVIRHEYNELGLLTRQYSEGTSLDSAIDDRYSYDLRGNVILVEDKIRGLATTREYDEHSNLIREILANGHTASYEYDPLGRCTSLHIDEKQVDYAYDAVHLRAVSYQNYTHTYDKYDLSGRLKKVTMIGNIGNFNLRYDLNGRIAARYNPYWKEVFIKYDEVGNLIFKRQSDRFGIDDLHYEYDDLNQLTYEEIKDPCHYAHDSLNNRILKNESEYKLNDLNQLLTTDENTFEYDANGNMTLHKTPDVEIHYIYDALDRLIAIKNGSSVVRYTYDSFNRRIKTEEDGETTTYLYARDNEVGSVSTLGKKEFRVLGTGLGAEIGAAVLIELNGKILAPIHDISGSVVCLIEPDSGNIFESYRYTSFGELIGPYYGTDDNPWLFAGKRRDSSGLINFGRRYYNPEFGRWITCDPQGFTDGPNLYAYVNNNPLTHFDEYGLFDGYWDCTPEESAMYNPQAQYRGMANAATMAFTGARDFFFGSTYELGASIHSEFWGNPNDPNRITPISQRSSIDIGLLAGGTAIELSPAKFLGLGGQAVKWLGKGAMKIPAVNRAVQVAQRSFRHFGRGKQVAHNVIKNASKQSNFNAKITSIQKDFFGASKRVLRQRFAPDSLAEGAHSVFRKNPINSRTEKYQTYWPQSNPRNPNPWELGLRFDGASHYHRHFNKITGKKIETPHVHDPNCPGRIRYPQRWEVP